MPRCDVCNKTLATRSSLRRHKNTQHEHKEHYFCACGGRFLDPAARSRCKSTHNKSFGCPACVHSTKRKDSLILHIRQKHPKQPLLERQILTLPPKVPLPETPHPDSPVMEPPVVPDSIPAAPSHFLPPMIYAPVPVFAHSASPPYSERSNSSGYSDASMSASAPAQREHWTQWNGAIDPNLF